MTATCSVNGCEKPSRRRGWCGMHYARVRRHGTPDLPEGRWPKGIDPLVRLFASVESPDADGCWMWTGSTDSSGYGQMWIDGRLQLTHRFAYEQLRQPIPDGLVLDHLCLTPLCCNPFHLEPVTNRVNIQRARAMTTHCPQGHAYEGDNLYLNPRGFRQCRQCVRDAGARWRARRAA